MKKIFLIGFLVFSSSCYAQGPIGTPTAMMWGGMPYGNPAMWSSQLHHYSSGPAITSGYYDPSIQRAAIYNDYYRAEMYWRKKELWKKHNPQPERKTITRKPFDTTRIYAEGRILWPVVFKDKRYYKYMRQIERIVNKTSSKSWDDIKKFYQIRDEMVYILKSNISEYPSGYYGKARVFLNDLSHLVT